MTGTSRARLVSNYCYQIQIELDCNEVAEFTMCSMPRIVYDGLLEFDTLDGTNHLFNLEHVVGYWFKKQENN